MLLQNILQTLVFSYAVQAIPVAEADVLNIDVDYLKNLELTLNMNLNEESPLLLSSSSKEDSILDENPELFALHRQLVSITSISRDEYAVSKFLQRYLKSLGLGFQLYVDKDDSRNIYAFGGKNASSSVLLSSHIDTVPPFFDYYIIDSKDSDDLEIHGRGSCDAKGSVAAQIIAAKELIEEGIVDAEEISLLFVHSEEIGGSGMRSADEFFIDEDINWDSVIFGEPTENKLAVGHKGIFLAHIEVFGKASHSGYPELGVDANKILIEIMHEIENYPWPTSEMLNQTTVNIGMIDAGRAANVISPYAHCSILLRLATNVSLVEPVVKEIVSKYEKFALNIDLNLSEPSDPVFLDYEVPGFDTIIASYSTDIPNLTQRGFSRYLYGPGSIHVAHGDNEFVHASSLLKAVEDYKNLVLFSLGR